MAEQFGDPIDVDESLDLNIKIQPVQNLDLGTRYNPLDGFKKYEGGYDVDDEDYWGVRLYSTFL